MEGVKRVVLAYSGGVDTSVCIPYLKKGGVITTNSDLDLFRAVVTPQSNFGSSIAIDIHDAVIDSNFYCLRMRRCDTQSVNQYESVVGYWYSDDRTYYLSSMGDRVTT